MLKMTDVKLELVHDMDMFQFIDKGMHAEKYFIWCSRSITKLIYLF